ncbi:ATP-dependent helicase HrpB [Catellatospora sp. IY07-71]|uniref:ATP-dependent helicase HrpB n=1 Tax=Catellatospora sp. IY07-71 TaxID=2728827 RepID=UPI001BB3972F|nr:ATP-dependent helicase HrpB [Catellatospora sp. IY07-71]BCJ77560.1 ATP-dependent helicase HrpB [Catellatospora sp. IY07-71]
MLPDSAETDLPVRAALPALLDALAGPGTAVLVAPPGSGKTTLAPLALAGAYEGRIVVAEPRRVAARAAARRMAELTGTPLGGPIGYSVRGDSRTGRDTRVEVVTTGLLVQRLQHDPELAGVGAILLDEVHERQLDTDLALAFTTDVRAALRPDLRLVAASATAQAARLSAALGPGTPVVTATGSPYPVEERWRPPTGPVDAPYGLRVDPRLLDHVAAVTREALRDTEGDLLVFLPGAGELDGVAARLGGLPGIDLLRLHGRQAAGTQDAALRPGPRRRVVLATAVAESSLTVPGVRVVVDAGLARVPRTDLGRGLGALVTVRASRAAAHQRAGRAGRQGPGVAYRCWSQAEHPRLPEHPDPEIASADLTAFVLQLACWSSADGSGLALLDPPPAAAAQVARETLTALGALDAEARVTARGRAIAAVGAHPRLARALLDASAELGAHRAAEVVALLAADTPIPTDDLSAAWRRLRDGVDPAASAAWRTEVRRLTPASRSGAAAGPPDQRGECTAPPDQHGGGRDRATANPDRAPGRPGGGRLPDDLAAALVVGLAYPERVARLRTPGGRTYLMAGGTAAELAPGSPLTGVPWLAVAAADRQPGSSSARIRLAAATDEATARQSAAALLATADEIVWADGDVVARQVTRLGAITLTERPLTRPDRELVAAALAEGLRREGLRLLRWTPEATALRERMAFCAHALGDPWPAVDDEALLARAGQWLGGALGTARRRDDLQRIDVAAALRTLLPWPQAAQLDQLAPERLEVPSGSRVRVDYTDPAAPVLAVKVQEVFGWTRTPRLAGDRVPVVLHLLSPAGRPAAVTGDLVSFWRNGYPQVRAELRGRYPRHPWPEDPTAAEPTRRAKPRGT